MMRKTAKMTAALAIVPFCKEPYAALVELGYRWNSGEQKWERRPDETAITTGKVDIRLRTGTGEIKEQAIAIARALESLGYHIVSTSVPYPDDRHGPAVTARVYLQVLIP